MKISPSEVLEFYAEDLEFWLERFEDYQKWVDKNGNRVDT